MDSQEQQMRPELEDRLRLELFAVKNYRTGPLLKLLGTLPTLVITYVNIWFRNLGFQNYVLNTLRSI